SVTPHSLHFSSQAHDGIRDRNVTGVQTCALPISFFYEKKETKKPALCHLSKGGFCSRARLKISKGQVVFFEKLTQKISTFKPLPIFILSVLSSLPKARLSKNKIF